MSGSGLLAPQAAIARSAEVERRDLLALLARRRRTCKLVAEKAPEFARDAAAWIRQLEILEGDIAAGLHEGEAGQ
jgi:hypothetical protein